MASRFTNRSSNSATYHTRAEYGLVKTDPFFSERLHTAKNLYYKDVLAHFGCVNAIEFSENGFLLASGGDDRRVLLHRVATAAHKEGTQNPFVMKAEHNSNIFCLAFSAAQDRLFSGGNDEQVIVHDIATSKVLDFFPHELAVYSLSASPVDNHIFASAGDDGKVLLMDTRVYVQPEPQYVCVASSTAAFHAVMFNPVEPRIIATANSRDGPCLWDIRKPKHCVLRFGNNQRWQHCAMSVSFNETGRQLLCLRRRKCPILYDIAHPDQAVELTHEGYSNACTMKSCCFAGAKHEYAVSGADNGRIYLWKIPSLAFDGPGNVTKIEEAHLVLKGHRSIVNQVRFNQQDFLLASSGVEKMVKLWSVFPLKGGGGDLEKETYLEQPRRNMTMRDYARIYIHGQHAINNRSTEEDPSMIAFFDSLIQQERSPLLGDLPSVLDSDPSSTDSESETPHTADYYRRRPTTSFLSSSSATQSPLLLASPSSTSSSSSSSSDSSSDGSAGPSTALAMTRTVIRNESQRIGERLEEGRRRLALLREQRDDLRDMATDSASETELPSSTSNNAQQNDAYQATEGSSAFRSTRHRHRCYRRSSTTDSD